MQNKFDDITLALAGAMQSIALVREIAETGKANPEAFETCVHSLFQTNPNNIDAVYGDIDKIKIGLKKLIETMGAANSDRTSTRYMLSLIHLQKKIAGSAEIMQKLADRIQQAKKQSEYFSLIHSNVIANLADIYLSVVTPFSFRIIIWGNQRILGATENMDKIRALLLAGIRSIVLWRQVGGSRLQFIFSRAKIKKTAENFLAELEHKGKTA